MLRIRASFLALAALMIFTLPTGCVTDSPQGSTDFTPPEFPSYAGRWKVHSIDGVTQYDTLIYWFTATGAMVRIDSSKIVFIVGRNGDKLYAHTRRDSSTSKHPAMLDTINTVNHQQDTLHIRTPIHHIRLVKLAGSSPLPVSWLYIGSVWQCIAIRGSVPWATPAIKLPFQIDNRTMRFVLPVDESAIPLTFPTAFGPYAEYVVEPGGNSSPPDWMDMYGFFSFHYTEEIDENWGTFREILGPDWEYVTDSITLDFHVYAQMQEWYNGDSGAVVFSTDSALVGPSGRGIELELEIIKQQ